MSKIEIDKDRVSTLLKKSIPWIIIGGAAVAGGIILYKKGIRTGQVFEWNRISSHLADPGRATIFIDNLNPKLPPIVGSGIKLDSADSIPTALKIIEAKVPAEEFNNAKDELIAYLTNHITGGKN